MTPLNVKVKKLHPDAKLPTYATDGSGAFDLYAVHKVEGIPATTFIHPGEAISFRTGLSFEIPPGHAMFVLSRSGHGFKNGIRLSNSIGLIDSDYRGEVAVKLHRDSQSRDGVEDLAAVAHHDRIAQAVILPVPKVAFEEVTELSETDRGSGGFGSTGS